MKKLDTVSVVKEEKRSMIPLGANYNVCKVCVKVSSVHNDTEIKVEYAQNGIISELVHFGNKTVTEDGIFEFSIDTLVTASHIYVTTSDSEVIVEDIDVYEADDIFITNNYPDYVDFDFEKNYYLDFVKVFTPENGYYNYTIYTSMDGRNFDELARKTSSVPCSADGDCYPAGGKEARIIRVYVEYCSATTQAIINDVQIEGTESGTDIQKKPEIYVEDFKNSVYDIEITAEDTFNEVYGIIERRLGSEYKSWFVFNLAPNPVAEHDFDYFSISSKDGKVEISGNNGVSLSYGLNHYLKYCCNVHISQVGDQINLPSTVILPSKTIFRETKAKLRYAYNYCTLSYSMAFWGKKEWRDELDWLALNGVNLILDTTAQEEVWRRFLIDIGYSNDDTKKFIAGPGYYAWAYMANLSGFGGPVHDSWFQDRTEMARYNHLIMRKLGMQPVLQGYSGMIPSDILEYDKNAEVIPQGTWCLFERPSMLRTTSSSFKKYADKFYKAQREVYGDITNYYATDPFHEGGNTSDMSVRSVAKEVLSAMVDSNPRSVWVIQSWAGNPSSELLEGIGEATNGKEHALILDLYAEKMPHHHEGTADNPSYGYSEEFNNIPWIFCMLNNFGGRLGLHGHLDNLNKNIPYAFNNRKKIAGIGITPEASVNNPVLYDFLFECIWQENAEDKLPVISLDKWLNDYTTRRYGKESKTIQAAWEILKDTVYNAKLNMLGQGAPESVVNARPGINIKAASTWGNSVIQYDKKKLKTAASLLLEDYETLKDNKCYMYDVATVLQQILSNTAQDVQNEMSAAYISKNAAEFTKLADEFLNIIDDMEKVTATSEYYLLGRWIEQAKALAKNSDDFTKRIYERNAKALITTWGGYNQSEIGGLHDYSNRQWSGLIGDFYKGRWKLWIKEKTDELLKNSCEENINWFEWEWRWVRDNTVYPVKETSIDLKALFEKM